MNGWGCARSTNANSKCCTGRCGWDFWIPREHTFHRALHVALRRRLGLRKHEARGNDGRRKAWKSNSRISTLPTVLGNRRAISTFPPARRLPLIISPEHKRFSEKCYLCPRIKVLPMFPVGHLSCRVERGLTSGLGQGFCEHQRALRYGLRRGVLVRPVAVSFVAGNEEHRHWK